MIDVNLKIFDPRHKLLSSIFIKHVCQLHSISREIGIKRTQTFKNEKAADLNISQGLSAVLYSLDPEQNKLLEVLLSITIDFYLTKVTASQQLHRQN